MSTRTPLSKRARPPPSPSSSPDPITARVEVGLSPFKLPSPRASSARKRAVAAVAATPTKKRKGAEVQVTPMKAIGRGGRNEVGVSPWRIKVMVEAQRDGEEGGEGERGEVVFGFGEGSGSGAKGGNAGRKSARGVFRSVMVPLKGDSPAKRKAVRKATPAKKRGTPARRDIAVEEKSAAVAPMVPVAETPTTAVTRRVRNIRSLAAAGKNAVAEPTLAAMRSRRSLLPPSSSAGVSKGRGSDGKGDRAASVVTDDDASVSGRSALSWVNPNSLISPESASKSRVDESSSPSVRKEATFQERDSFVISEGGSLSLPDLRSSLPPSSDSYFGGEERDGEDMTEEEALADVSTASAWRRSTTFEETVGDRELTYVSSGNSYTPVGRGGAMERGGVLLGDKSVGVATLYGEKRTRREEDDAGAQPEASMLPEDTAQPVEMEYTYVQGRVSYTPLKPREPEKQSPVFDTSVGAETFYGLPQDDDKGKGKEVDCDTSVLTKEQSHYSSSPPAPKAHMAKHLPSSSASEITPMMPQKRQGDEGDAAGAPPPVRVERDTPNLSRVRDASEMMSDALEMEVDMVMEGEEFGDGFDDAAPLTPESVERSVPPAEASVEEAGTGILSPPATSAPAAPSSPRQATECMKEKGGSAGHGAEVWEEQWEKERRENVQRAREVGAVVIEDSTTIVDEIPGPAHTSSSSSYSSSLREGTRRTKPPIDDDLLSTLTTTLPTPSGLVWKREHYAHLSAVLQSSSTPDDVGEERFEVKLDRPERLLNREVIRRLRVDGEGFLRLTGRECAGVERFLRRERAKGREWGVGEVVRRVAGLRIAEVRRRWLGHRRVEV